MLRLVKRAVPLLLAISQIGISTASALAARFDSGPPTAPTRVATIQGRITEKETGQPIAAVQLIIVGTRQGGATTNNGEFSIAGVAPGQIQLRASRIGYQPMVQAVTVPATGSVTVNFALERAVARLEEVITTATGEQSRREFGNAVSSVKMDSLAKIAPVTTVQEMLQARVPGLQVFQGVGVTGANEPMRIRGLSSLSLGLDPLMIVDGVRYDQGTVTGSFATSSSRVGDLNPEEIESVDVIKGPSAAALYGTAAANGVIIIKTKRGTAGQRTRWTVFGEQGAVTQPNAFENNWRSWGHNLNASGQPVGNPTQCLIYKSVLKQCQIDSLTSNNPYTNPLTSPFRDASGNLRSTPRSSYGVQASGGSDLLRFFVSGTHQGETGPFVMPDSEVKRITVLRGSAPRNTQVYPNQLRQDSYRGNFQIALAQNATVDVAAGYSDRTFWQPFDAGFFAGLTFQLMTAPGCAIKCSATLRADGVNWTNGTQREYVGDIFSVEQKTNDQRFTGSGALNWAPLSWLQVRSTVGIDQSNTYEFRDQLLGEGPNQATAWGPNSAQSFSGKDFERNNVNRYSVDVGTTATRQLTSRIQSKTTLGAQWFKDETYRGTGEGYGFGPGVSTPNSASQRLASEFTTENATYGAFVQEDIAWRDRLYASAAVRTDQNSAFGRTVGTTAYPRASLSYVISDEAWFPHIPAVDKLRLRTAVGKAGVQPGTTAALQFLSATTFPVSGLEQPALQLSSIGNPTLKPEVTTEVESGADIGVLNDRVSIEATLYRKISHNALFQRPLPPSFGAGANQFQNLARVENRGFELSVDAGVVRTPMLDWQLRVAGSHNVNRLVTVGDATLPTSPGSRNVVGYPINGLWDRAILSYKDADGNGIIAESEIVVADTQSFRGSSVPQYEAQVANDFGLLHGRLHIVANFDYRGQYWNQWGYANQRCVSTANCRAVNDPNAPQADQVAAVMGASSVNRTLWGFFVQNDFIRFRELSLTYNLPDRITNFFGRGHPTTLVLSGRNIGMLWTKYPGLDPESNSSAGSSSNDFFSEPPLRYFIGRINVAF
jgi:TonB-linked SusC/RagA family outer membrane protein